MHGVHAQTLKDLELRNQAIKEFIEDEGIERIIFTSDVQSTNMKTIDKTYSDSIVYAYPDHYFRSAKYQNGDKLETIYQEGEYLRTFNGDIIEDSPPLLFERGDIFYQKLNLVRINDSCKVTVKKKITTCVCEYEKTKVTYKFNNKLDLVSMSTIYFDYPPMNSHIIFEEYHPVKKYPQFQYPQRVILESEIAFSIMENIVIKFVDKDSL